MKPFDLGLANKGEKLVTRGGKEVTQFHQFKLNHSKYPCYAVVNGNLECFTTAGEYSTDGMMKDHDLFMASVKREAWINIYPGSTRMERHATRKEADACAQAGRIDCIRIEWEE